MFVRAQNHKILCREFLLLYGIYAPTVYSIDVRTYVSYSIIPVSICIVHPTISIICSSRFTKMLLYFGLEPSSLKEIQVGSVKPYAIVSGSPSASCTFLQMNEFFKMISDLSLEYRTVYARLTQRKERRKRKTGGLIPFVSDLVHKYQYQSFSYSGCMLLYVCTCIRTYIQYSNSS